MIRVISSPSSSTTGLATLIFGMEQDLRDGAGRRFGAWRPRGVLMTRPRGSRKGDCALRNWVGRRARRRYIGPDMDLGAAMPGAGTDKTRRWTDAGGPVVILVEPQLAENVGTTARAM